MPFRNLTSLDKFIVCLKELLEFLAFEGEIKDELKLMVSKFSYFNSLFAKFDFVFSKLELSSHVMKNDKLYNLTNVFKATLWLMYVIMHEDTLGEAQQAAHSIGLMAALFIEVLNGVELISNYLISKTQENKIDPDQIESEICNLLSIKSREQLKVSQKKFKEALTDLMTVKGLIKSNWSSVGSIPNTYKALDLHYQKILRVEDVDLRFFVKDRKSAITPSKFTPFQKQGHSYKQFNPNAQMFSHRVLDFESVPERKPIDQFAPKTGINFQHMLQSPYQMKHVVPATPMTSAMELYNWLFERVAKCEIYQAGVITEVGPSNPLYRFFELLDAESQHRIVKKIIEGNIEKIIEAELGASHSSSKIKSKLKNTEKLFNERKTLIMNFYFSSLQDFIVREQKVKNSQLTQTLKSQIFHQSLLVNCVETVYFILNISSLDFQELLALIEIPAHEYYLANLSQLNFESLIPLPLKNHFLDLEKFMINYLLWERPSAIMENDLKPEHSQIYERVLIYVSSVIKIICSSLGLSEKFQERSWDFFKTVFTVKRSILHGRFVDQIIMCCVYSMSKICQEKTKFQEIITSFQKASSFFSKSLFHSIVYECKLADDSRSDIIQFYNKMFIVEFKNQIFQCGRKTEEEIIESKSFHEDENHNSNGMVTISVPTTLSFKRQSSNDLYSKPRTSSEALNLLKSPLKLLTSTPFTHYIKQPKDKAIDMAKSPTSLMMKMHVADKMPYQSKKVLNFDRQKRPMVHTDGELKLVNKTETFEELMKSNAGNLNAKLQKFK